MKPSLASSLIHAGVLVSMMGVSVHGGDCCLVNEHQSFTPSAADAGDRFGYSASAHGMRLVIGAPFGDTLTAGSSGQAYVYVLDSGGVWVPDESVDAGLDAASGDLFGAAVDIAAERLIVGAPRQDDLPLENVGSAYIFKEQSGNWVLEQKLAASDPEALADFGHSVAIDGELAVVGSPYDDNPAPPILGPSTSFDGTAAASGRRRRSSLDRTSLLIDASDGPWRLTAMSSLPARHQPLPARRIFSATLDQAGRKRP